MSPDIRCGIISKKSVLLHLYGEFLSSDSLKYGFKKNSSCSHALFTVSESVRYFTYDTDPRPDPGRQWPVTRIDPGFLEVYKFLA